MKTAWSKQEGVTLIESLIAILLFSMGILALVGMYAAATSRTTDSQYRVEAANYANRIVGQIWANVDRSTSRNSDQQPAGLSAPPGSGGCAFTGSASANAAVTQWVTDITTAGNGTSRRQQHHAADHSSTPQTRTG